ncbi:hypothetical protein QA601_09520 [Chitinispirillales bacterium ANBcel5]|uniref:lipoate--protein ligase family protein n=1 Tax=Cellulosispirillum alkaliphilum TaxID=3039283 RepID=UPI002A5634C7|nr:hypothetical protein [Chitinispirillales bacterium ANBcel5]
MIQCPNFPGPLRKNDAVFMYGAIARQFPYVEVYQQKEIEIVHGPSCKQENEIMLERCAADGVTVEQRRGGGGTVVLSPGVLVTVIVGERERSQTALDIFKKIHDAFIGALNIAGIYGVEHRGISDLAIKEKKILGSSLYMGRKPDRYYYQSSLMVCSDLSLLNDYLFHPPTEPQYRAGRSHMDFCTTLHKEGYRISIKDLQHYISSKLPVLLSEQDFASSVPGK